MAIADNLILFDAPNSNSFISLTRANEILDFHIEAPLWETQDDDTKKRLLIKAYNQIISLEGIVLSAPVPVCLEETQADTALNYLIGDSINETRRVKTEKTGPMSTTYQDQDMLEQDTFADASIVCLNDLGALQPNFVGAVGSVQKTRA